MSAIAFDTFRLVRRLVSSGMPEAQAEQVVDAVIEAINDLATKDDLRDLEQRLTIKIGAMLAAAIGLIVAVVKVAA